MQQVKNVLLPNNECESIVKQKDYETLIKEILNQTCIYTVNIV